MAKDPKSKEPLKPHEKAAVASKIGELLSGGDGKENAAALDGFMQSQVNPLASDIIKVCLPNGLAVRFPENVSVCFFYRHFSSVANSSLTHVL